MAEQNFKPGDQVVLLSGGPIMTVNAVYTESREEGFQVGVVWFVNDELKNGRLFSGAIRPSTDLDLKRKTPRATAG